MWQVEFETDKFLPFLPEECQSNPGVYGFELAAWLAENLAKRGITTSYPLGEDWGWLIEFINNETALEITIGCGSQAEVGEGYQGNPIRWNIFIRPHASFLSKLKGIDIEKDVQSLAKAILSALDEEDISVEIVENP